MNRRGRAVPLASETTRLETEVTVQAERGKSPV